VSLLSFHHVTGMPMPRVGTVLTLAAVIGLAATPLTGVLVDRYGARAVVVGGYLLRAAGFATYPLVNGAPMMFAVTAVVALGDRSFPAAVQALIAEIARGTDRDRLIAAQRSLRNAGLGAGGLIAGLALGVGSGIAYHGIVLADGASMVVAAALLGTLRGARTAAAGRDTSRGATRPRRAQARPGGYRQVLKDRTFVLLTCVNAPVALGYMVLNVVLPVYVAQVLRAAPSWPGVLYAVNTVGVALFQVPVTRLLRRRRRTRSAALGGAVFTLAFLLFGAVGGVPGGVLPLVGVFLATALFTLGELMHGATASALATDSAPERLRGRYLAFYQLSWSLPTAVAPALFTALIAVSPTATWLLLAAGTGAASTALLRLEHRLPATAVRPWTRTTATATTASPGRSPTAREGSGVETGRGIEDSGAETAEGREAEDRAVSGLDGEGRAAEGRDGTGRAAEGRAVTDRSGTGRAVVGPEDPGRGGDRAGAAAGAAVGAVGPGAADARRGAEA
jgi:MFS family permease